MTYTHRCPRCGNTDPSSLVRGVWNMLCTVCQCKDNLSHFKSNADLWNTFEGGCESDPVKVECPPPRDVDKYLKKQRDDNLREMFG